MRVPSFGLDRPSVFVRMPTWVWVSLLIASAVWLLGPRVSGWQLLHLHKEDGTTFLQDWLALGWASFWEPYTGYQHLAPRTVTAACASGPASWFAPCVGVGAGLVRIALAFVAGAVLAPYARTPRWGMAAGFLFVFVPVGQQEVLGNLTNLRWFLDAGCLLICVGLFGRRLGLVASALGFIGALSDPLVILLLPVALWRIASAANRAAALPAAAIATGGIVHWVLLVPSARPTDLGWFVRQPLEALEQLLVRGGAVAQFGQNGTEVLLLFAIPIAVAAGLLPLVLVGSAGAEVVTQRIVGLLILSGFGVLACTLVFAPRAELALSPAWQLGNGSRYSVAPAILIGAATLVAASYAKAWWLRWLCPVLLTFAAAGDATGDSWNTHGPTWASSVARAADECSGPAGTVRVQVTPTGVPTDWRAEIPCEWIVGS